MVRSLRPISHFVKTINFIFSQRSADGERVSIIESDFEHDKYKDQLESRDPRQNVYGEVRDQTELQQLRAVREALQGSLRQAGVHSLHCCLEVSSEQLGRLAQDVLRMSHCEPCGVRGALIFLELERKAVCHRLAAVQADPATLPTFELHVRLKEDTSRWRAFKKVFLTLKECLRNGTWKETPIVLCSGYQMEKKRLYRPNPA